LDIAEGLCKNWAMPDWVVTALWVAGALLVEKWLDYVERPKWLRRRALKRAARKFVIIHPVPRKPKPPAKSVP